MPKHLKCCFPIHFAKTTYYEDDKEDGSNDNMILPLSPNVSCLPRGVEVPSGETQFFSGAAGMPGGAKLEIPFPRGFEIRGSNQVWDCGGSIPRQRGHIYKVGNSFRCACYIEGHDRQKCQACWRTRGNLEAARALSAQWIHEGLQKSLNVENHVSEGQSMNSLYSHSL